MSSWSGKMGNHSSALQAMAESRHRKLQFNIEGIVYLSEAQCEKPAIPVDHGFLGVNKSLRVNCGELPH